MSVSKITLYFGLHMSNRCSVCVFVHVCVYLCVFFPRSFFQGLGLLRSSFNAYFNFKWSKSSSSALSSPLPSSFPPCHNLPDQVSPSMTRPMTAPSWLGFCDPPAPLSTSLLNASAPPTLAILHPMPSCQGTLSVSCP